jgi:threonyl-tRNA synthetase
VEVDLRPVEGAVALVDVVAELAAVERVGSDELWDRAEGILRDALESRELGYEVNEGDGAFYGPKIDFHLTDSLGRSWQLGTVQLDFNLPERFGLEYAGEDNALHRPAMIHRAIFGSFERFVGLLIEHYGGEFPIWLAPVQGIVLPISDRHAEAAAATRDALQALGVRAELDARSESIGRRIREAELQKIPYMLVVGDREIEEGSVAVRRHGEGDLGSEPVEAFARRVADQRPIGYTAQR